MATTPAPAGWEDRFRVPRTLWARVARLAPERGLVASSATGNYQLHAWDVASGALRVLSNSTTGLIDGAISPDGRWVVWHDDSGGNESGPFVAVPWEGGAPTVIGPDLPEGFAFTAAFSPSGTVFAAPVLSGDAWRFVVAAWSAAGPGDTRLVDAGPGFVTALAVDDSGRIAYATTGAGGSLTTSLKVLDSAGAEVLEVRHPDAAISAVAYAPDGSSRLLASTTASGRLRPMVLGPDGSEERFELPDVDGDLQPTAWSRDTRTVILLRSHRSTTTLGLLDLVTRAWRSIPHPPGAIAIGSPRPDAAAFLDDGTILTTLEAGTHPPAAVALDPGTGAIARTPIPPPVSPPSRPWRSVDIPSTDGAMAQGWLAVPAGVPPFPAVIDIHGGPEDQENDRWYPAAQAWLDAGYAVLSVNYRGSTGFGRDFEQAIWGEPGRRELDDVVAARRLLVEEGIADPRRIVPTGGSYGGYLTLLALTARPELWAAGVAYVAIADWTLMYEDGEALREYQLALFGGSPQDRPELYRRASPLTTVEALRAPLRIVQGRNDPRCPPRQMETFIERAQALGKALEVEWFDAGHGHGGMEQRIAWQARDMAFVQRALEGGDAG